jgi:hypothetical protein
MYVAFKIPCVYDYIKKLCRKQEEVIQNHPNPNIRAIGQGSIRGLNLSVGPTTVQVANYRFGGVK